MTINHATRRLVLGGMGALALTPSARAHRLARTETEVRLLDDGRVDVIHVYHLQDVQAALFRAGRIDQPDVSSLRARARLALYTDETFTLSTKDVPVALETIGVEIEGDSVHVYQEGVIGSSALTIDAHMLRDLLKRQINSVNIVSDGRTQTLEFKGDDGPRIFDRKSVATDGSPAYP